MAQPWKFHSLAVVVSSRIHGLAGAGGGVAAAAVLAAVASTLGSDGFAAVGAVGLVSAGASDFAVTGVADLVSVLASVFASGLASPSASSFKKNSASFPSIRLMNTRNDLPSGPTATSSGVPFTRSTTGDCFTSVSQGYARAGPSICRPTTTSRDLSSVPGKLIGTGYFA